MKITETKCKTALSPSRLPGLDYSLNPYRGCMHKCAYCYVPNVLRVRRDEWGDFVNVKTNIPNVLAKELRNKKPGTVGISTVTDPYQPVEKKYKLTRYCLEQLLRVDFPICIQTKSDIVIRDIDIISKFSKPEVMISIATLNDSERKIFEPNASSITNRLDALKIYSDAGIKTSIFFGPVYPTIKIKDIPNIIDIFVEHGVKEILIDKFNLKPGILPVLKKKFPGQINNIRNIEYFNRLLHEILIIAKEKNLDAKAAL